MCSKRPTEQGRRDGGLRAAVEDQAERLRPAETQRGVRRDGQPAERMTFDQGPASHPNFFTAGSGQ